MKKYRVKQAYGVYRKGQIITPTGMLRDELLMLGRIEPVPDEPAPKPAPVIEEAVVLPDIRVETAIFNRKRRQR